MRSSLLTRLCSLAILFCDARALCCAFRVLRAQTLTGTVKNGTTNKPAAGDDVVLIKLAQGMEEAAAPRPTPGQLQFQTP